MLTQYKIYCLFARPPPFQRTDSMTIHVIAGGILMYYNTCPHCGAHLDPDEHCDCLARVRGKKIRTGNCRIHGTMGRTRYARDRT